MAQKPKKKKSQVSAPLPSERPPRKSVPYRPFVDGEPLHDLVFRGPPIDLAEESERWPEIEREAIQRGAEIVPLGSSVPARYPPAPDAELVPPSTPPPLQTVPAHMTAEQRAEHDRIVKESQDVEAERQKGFFKSVLEPVAIDPSAIGAKGSLWGYYGGATPPAPFGSGPTFEETLEPLKIFDVLGRGIRKLVTGLPETQLAAPGEESTMIANIATDMLTDPLMALGLAKGAISGLRGIRGMLDDVVSAGLAGQDPGVAQMFSRVRPEQLDMLATQLQQELLQSGIKKLPPNFQRALTRALAPGGAIADQRGAIHPAYEGMFTRSPSNMYSQMGRSLERKLPGRASPKEMRELVNKFWKKGDYKKAELEWSGLDQWLTAKHNTYPKDKLTKEDILDYVRKNELEVKVVTRRGTMASGQYSSYVEGDPANWSDYQEILITLPSREARYSQHFADDTIAHFRTVERKFKDPITGEERRVLFMEEMQSDWHQKGRQLGYADEGDLLMRSDEYDEMRELFEEAEQNYEVLTEDYGMSVDDAYYQLEEAKTRHGDIEYDLEATQGEWNDLDMEADEIRSELQLDLERFEADKQMDLPGTPERTPPDVEIPDEMQEKLDDLQMQIDDHESDLRAQEDMVSDAESAHDTLQEADEQLTEARQDFEGADETPVSDKPPPAPFGQTWTELGFKRLLQKAVDDGYDTVAWSRGQVQADRYNAAAYVEDLKYTKRRGVGKKGVEEDQIVLTFRKKDDVDAGILDTWHEKVAPEARLEDWVGKQISKKIRDGEQTGLLDNDDLWLGGEELKFYYDGEMRNVANKLVKRFGGKVTKESMGPTFQVVEIPADSGSFVSWADTEIPRLRLQRNALREQEKKLTALSPPSSYRPNLHHQVTVLQRKGAELSNRSSMLTAAQARVNAGTGLDKIDPTVIEAFKRANPDLKMKYGIKDPTNRTRTGKMVFDTLEEAQAASAPTVNTIRINPKMREAIVERGFPLYQILLGTTGAAAGTKATAEAMSAHKEGQ